MSPAELESVRQSFERMRARHDAALRAAQRRWSSQARICADELIRTGSTVLSTDDGHVRGRIVRFWRGDSVLDLECVGPDLDDRGRSKTRLSRRHQTDVDVIAGYLLWEAARLDSSGPG